MHAPLTNTPPTRVKAVATGKITAAQVHDNCPAQLEDWCKRVAAHLESTKTYRTKIKNNDASIGKLLADIAEACDEGGSEACREKFYPRLGRSRTFELKAVAAGTKTLEQIREDTRKRVAKHRAQQAPSVTSDVTDSRTEPTASHTDIIKVWLRASPESHQHSVDSIGLKPWFAAIPRSWYPQLEQLLAEQRRPVIDIVPAESAPASDDIPSFLDRRCQASEAQAGATDGDMPEQAPADNPAEEPRDDEPEEDELDDEPELKPKRKVKLIEYELTFAKAIEITFSNLADLGAECREVVDSVSESEGLQQTPRIQTFEQTAEDLENIEAPGLEGAIAELPVKFALPKPRYMSRAARAANASTILQACVITLDSVNGAGRAAAQALISNLENTIATVDDCEFPGMYG